MKKNLVKVVVASALMSLMVAFAGHATEIATPSNAVKAEVTVEADDEATVEDDEQMIDDVVSSDDDNDDVVVETETDETVDSGAKDQETEDDFFDFPEIPEIPEEPEPEIPDEPDDVPVATPSEPQRIPTEVVVTVVIPTVPDEPEDKPVATPSDAEKPEEPETPDEPEQPEQPEEPKDQPVATPSDAEKPEEPEDHPEQPTVPEEKPEQPEVPETPSEQPEHRVPQIPDTPVVRITDEPIPESVEPIVVIPLYPGDRDEEYVASVEPDEVVPQYPATLTIPKTGDETPLYPIVLFFAALIGMVVSAIGMMRDNDAEEAVVCVAAKRFAATAGVRESAKNADNFFYNNLSSKTNRINKNNRRMPVEREIKSPFEIRADNIHPPLK